MAYKALSKILKQGFFKLLFSIIVGFAFELSLYQSVVYGAYSFVVDSTFYFKTPREVFINMNYDFNNIESLKELPLDFSDWRGKDIPVETYPVARPDLISQRIYTYKDGRSIWFQLIKGRYERSMHVPAICYYNAGWSILVKDVKMVRVHKYSIPCGYLLVERDGTVAEELYFYMWPDKNRDFTKGCIMIRVVSVDNAKSDGDRIRLLKTFIKDLFEDVY